MFGAKSRLKQYLTQIRPWAMGINNRGWRTSDFTPIYLEKRSRSDEVIFPIPTLTLSSFDRLFLGPDAYASLLNFEHAASNFNEMTYIFNYGPTQNRENIVRNLHVGSIGTFNTGGLFAAYTSLSKLL